MLQATHKSFALTIAPFAFVVLWATGFVVSKLLAGHVAPVWFLGIRFPLAMAFMLAVALWQKAHWPSPRLAFHASVTGVFMHALYLCPFYWAVSNGMPAGVIALVTGLQPLFTAFLAVPMLKERVELKHWLGLVIGITGVCLVLLPKLSFALIGGITPLTISLAVFGTLSIAFGTVYQKKFSSGIPLSTGGVWQYAGAGVTALIITAIIGDYQFDFSLQAWAALGWAVIVLSVFTILLLLWLINRGAVSKLASMNFLVPGVTALMTYLWFGETLLPVQLFGMAICACAVLVVNRAARAPVLQ
ncbi:MAG TPA: DMT family transporter [Aestuariivirga sp.]